MKDFGVKRVKIAEKLIVHVSCFKKDFLTDIGFSELEFFLKLKDLVFIVNSVQKQCFVFGFKSGHWIGISDHDIEFVLFRP